MPITFISGLIGFGIAVIVFILFWVIKLKYRAPEREIRIYASLEELRSVGELVVFKVITKEIVTTSRHWLGEMGKKYFQWLVSTKKMAMIFEFDIDFRYDLRSPDFLMEELGEKNFRLKMPPCFYEVHIRNISFYDEQNAKFLPWLLPDLLNRAFGAGFSEEDKNLLIEEAKCQATNMAENLVKKMRSEVQNSARQTLEILSKSFGAEKVLVDFTDSKLLQSKLVSIDLENKK
ncbi:MAG: DUF4230 domain-containing protein [Candidatus Caldatribacteriota bacterium]